MLKLNKINRRNVKRLLSLSLSSSPPFSPLSNISLSSTVMIFGSSTDVGKTIISAGLSREALAMDKKVCYIKPVQTGELDEFFIQLYTNPQGTNEIFLRTLHHWLPAMAPHLAAQKSSSSVSDIELLNGLKRELKAFMDRYKSPSSSSSSSSTSTTTSSSSLVLVETAGGVLSPGPSKTLQADIYRPLRLPVILVGDARLGGITTTISAYESLKSRGYTVYAIAIVARPESDKYGNVPYLQEHFSSVYTGLDGDSSNAKWSIGMKPEVFSFTPLPEGLLHNWFHQNSTEFKRLCEYITERGVQEIDQMHTMFTEGQKKVWWPFTQHGIIGEKDTTFIESAHGEHFRTIKFKKRQANDNTVNSNQIDYEIIDMMDACASWWTQGVGHGNPYMSLALAQAAGRYGHVMFPSNLHPPAVQLTRYLLERGPGVGWADRVFFSDDGSTGMEIAIKMALRLNKARNGSSKDDENLVVLSQNDCYHGDTLGTMDTSNPSVFNKDQHPWYRPKGLSLEVPFVAYRKGILSIDTSRLTLSNIELFEKENAWNNIDQIYDIDARLESDSHISTQYREYIRYFIDKAYEKKYSIGALLIEPLMLGAGGLKFIDPLFQRILVEECKKDNIPIVYDEVAVGIYRLGPSTASSILKINPDISVYGKLLSGGYLPISVTLASDETYKSFLSDQVAQALLHGHSYTANPMGCVAALEAIRLFEKCPQFDNEKRIMKNSFDENDIKTVSKLPGVRCVMSMGSVFSVELNLLSKKESSTITTHTGYGNTNTSTVVSLLREERVYARSLGNVIYLMPSPLASAAEKSRLIRVLTRVLTKAFYGVPSTATNNLPV